MRINPCGKVKWIVERDVYHSIELDAVGNIVVPIVTNPDYKFGNISVWDEGIAIVSPAGRILSVSSRTKMLVKNDYHG